MVVEHRRRGLLLAWGRRGVAAALLLAAASAWGQAPPRPPLKLGVIPYLSPGTLIAEYASLRDHLARDLDRPVVIHTALDLRQFATRTERRDFGLVLTAPHLLQRALALGYVPLMAVRADFYAHILVPTASPVRNLRDLAGQRLHSPPPSAFTSIAIEQFLAGLGFRTDASFRTQRHNSENNALLAAARSERDAVAASRAVVQRLPAEIRGKLRVIASTPAAVSMLMLASPDLSDAEIARVRMSLASFPYSTAGLAYTAQSGSYLFPATPELIAAIVADMAAQQHRAGAAQ